MSARRVAVFGLGYVGLPLVRACLNAGNTVIGYDVDDAKVRDLMNGMSHVDDVSDDEISDWLSRGFTPTTDLGALEDIDVYVICVPTPLTRAGGPDLGNVEAAASAIEERLEAESRSDGITPLVILESTTYPGTTEEVVKPILERNGLRAAADFHLAFSPERIDPGNRNWNFENTPKVVGGLTPACADAAEVFYSPMTVRVVRTKGLKEAEMAKLLENTYRYVNIALVNELWKLSHELGIDIWDVIEAAETKPYGFQAFRPGPGVGGHCIPIDPNYLSHRVRSKLGQPFRVVELAQEINASMPEFIVQRVHGMLREQGKSLAKAEILILGVTYKKDVADIRESPAVVIIEALMAQGARVLYDDPYIVEINTSRGLLGRVSDLDDAIARADLVVLLQDHEAYKGLVARLPGAELLNTRGAGHASAGA